MFLSITKVENNRIAKFAEFEVAEEASQHAEQFDGFVHAGAYSPDLWVDGTTVSTVPNADLKKLEVKALMASLEAGQYMTRGEREGWLALIVAMAQQQGVTETQLYAANPFYKKLKDTDAQIAALRAQL
jgi:hypothetical protein